MQCGTNTYMHLFTNSALDNDPAYATSSALRASIVAMQEVVVYALLVYKIAVVDAQTHAFAVTLL